MRKIFYNKLVRDGIEKIITDNGQACELRTITDSNEFEQELLKKISEEADALARTNSREAFLKEYADLMVVLDALTHHLEFTEADIRVAIEENLARKGKYDTRQFLLWSEDQGYTSNESVQGISS